MESSQRKPRCGFTLVELLVVVAIIGVLVGMLLPAVQQARESARRANCQNNMRQLGLAMHNYHEANRVLPFGVLADLNEDDSPLNSLGSYEATWMIPILPYIDQQSLYDTLTPLMQTVNADQWPEDPSVAEQTDLPIQSLVCPSDPASPKATMFHSDPDFRDGFSGNYSMCNGSTKLNASNDDDPSFQNGIFYHYSSTRLKDIADGTSKTIMGGEHIIVREPNNQRDWRGRYYRGKHIGVLVSTLEPPNTRLNDEIRVCRNTLVVAPCVGRGDGDDAVMYFRSHHPGGAHVILADGSITFVSDSIQRGVFQALGTREGYEAASVP